MTETNTVMRLFLFIPFALALGPAFSQQPLRTDTAQPYERIVVVEVDSTKSADELYHNAKRWFADAFRDSKEVIQLDDPVTHTVVGKGNWKFHASIFKGSAVRNGIMRFSVEIATKDGRYRIRFYDYEHEGTPYAGSYSGTIYVPSAPACDLGVIYNDRGYCTHYFNRRDKADYTPTKFEARVCVEEVWPQIKANEEAMILSIKTAMLASAAGQTKPGEKSSSDW